MPDSIIEITLSQHKQIACLQYNVQIWLGCKRMGHYLFSRCTFYYMSVIHCIDLTVLNANKHITICAKPLFVLHK